MVESGVIVMRQTDQLSPGNKFIPPRIYSGERAKFSAECRDWAIAPPTLNMKIMRKYENYEKFMSFHKEAIKNYPCRASGDFLPAIAVSI